MDSWRKIKRTGNYRRQIIKEHERILQSSRELADQMKRDRVKITIAGREPTAVRPMVLIHQTNNRQLVIHNQFSVPQSTDEPSKNAESIPNAILGASIACVYVFCFTFIPYIFA